MRSELIFASFLLVLVLLFPLAFSQCNWPEEICVGNEKYQCNSAGEWEYVDRCPVGTECAKQTPTGKFVVCVGSPSQKREVPIRVRVETTIPPVQKGMLPLSLVAESVAVLVVLVVLVMMVFLIFRVSSRRGR